MTKQEAVKSGRLHVRSFLNAAYSCGEVYATIEVSRSGMHRNMKVFTVRDGKLWELFPALAADGSVRDWKEESKLLDAIAKDWRFSFKKRSFQVGGGGMDMFFALIDDLHGLAGMPYQQRKLIRKIL